MSNDQPLRVAQAQFKPAPGAARPGPDRDQASRPSAKPAKWEYWTRIKSAPPWKLAALSLGLEPASVTNDDPGSFPDAATFGRFKLITEAIKRRFAATDQRPVNLPEFIRWAASVSLDLPPELRALADVAPDGGSGRGR